MTCCELEATFFRIIYLFNDCSEVTCIQFILEDWVSFEVTSCYASYISQDFRNLGCLCIGGEDVKWSGILRLHCSEAKKSKQVEEIADLGMQAVKSSETAN